MVYCNIFYLFSVLFCVFLLLFPGTNQVLAEDPVVRNAPIWNEIDAGLAVATVNFETSSPQRHTLTILRLTAQQWQFEVDGCGISVGSEEQTARKWLEKADTSIVMNAGQFDTGLQYLGWLIHNGKNFGSRQHPIWKGLLVSSPRKPGDSEIEILDLKIGPSTQSELEYNQAVQSLMLFDETGTIRVNQSDKSARRSIIATDHARNIYLIITRDAVTLWELAEFLRTYSIGFSRAICLDGGSQSQLSVKTGALSFDIPGYQVPIPYVIKFKRK